MTGFCVDFPGHLDTVEEGISAKYSLTKPLSFFFPALLGNHMNMRKGDAVKRKCIQKNGEN